MGIEDSCSTPPTINTVKSIVLLRHQSYCIFTIPDAIANLKKELACIAVDITINHELNNQ
jgi:hypothetical protein